MPGKLIKPIAAILLLVLWPLAAPATDGDGVEASPSIFSLAGFGTLGVVHSSESQADFTNTLQANGAGHTRSWSPTVDSLIAGQVTAHFSPRLTAVVQVIAQQRFDNTYWPQLEWANIRYEITPDFSLRAGRISLPVFMKNDSRRIGYANPWVRPPVEVYRLVPTSSSDGVDATFRMSVGGAINTIQFSTGNTDTQFPNYKMPDGLTKVRRLVTFVDTFEHGFLTARFAYLHGDLTVDTLKPLFDAYRRFGPQGIAIANAYELHDSAASFLGAGISYEPGQWFVMSEWGHFESHSLAGEANGWYVSAGYRMGTVTPYATLASVKPVGNATDPGLDIGSLPPGPAAQATALNSQLSTALARRAGSQRTLSLGARWDFQRNMDAKLQLDHSRLGAGSQGLLVNPQPGFQPGGTLNLISATLDFVF
jgi:hypothetical protein